VEPVQGTRKRHGEGSQILKSLLNKTTCMERKITKGKEGEKLPYRHSPRSIPHICHYKFCYGESCGWEKILKQGQNTSTGLNNRTGVARQWFWGERGWLKKGKEAYVGG